MKWVEITKWIAVVIMAVLLAIRIWDLKKISPENPNSSIEKRLIFIELWIFIIFLNNTIGKFFIALCF